MGALGRGGVEVRYLLELARVKGPLLGDHGQEVLCVLAGVEPERRSVHQQGVLEEVEEDVCVPFGDELAHFAGWGPRRLGFDEVSSSK